jgi:hypothetical protein
VPPKAEVKQLQRRLAEDMKRAGHAKGEGGGGSTVIGPADPGAGQATGPGGGPWADALARVRGRLAKARAWRAWIDAAPDRTAADLAKRERRTRARVSQVLRLLDLAPAIVEDLERDDRAGPVPSELQLRSIAAIRERRAAVAAV